MYVGHSWDIRRISPGPPLSKDTVISKLLDHNITVGISPVGLSRFVPPGNWNAQNLRLYAAWVSLLPRHWGCANREYRHSRFKR
ncbi:hypothetical protein F5050DRAFT_1727951 [Lentinula boryana]|uniref:Uncharacterized protein n=1 Tax=Lentinula boryana TaxID=40481 RepID=A0ABQ8QQ45_9AGAR|nr:hypothetical protein F5050DRAFT_1727951 [Lentinula boryana]